MSDLGALSIGLELDLDGIDKQLKQLNKFQPKNLKLAVTLDQQAIQQQIKGFKTATISINTVVKFDRTQLDRELQALNRAKAIAVPISFTLDRAQLAQLRSDISRAVSVPVAIDYTAPRREKQPESKPKTQRVRVEGDDELEKKIEKAVKQGTKKAQSKGLFESLVAIPSSIVQSASSGFLQGVGFNSSAKFARGFMKTLEKEAKLEMDKVGETIGKGFTRLGQFTGSRLQGSVLKRLGLDDLSTVAPRLEKLRQELKPVFENLVDDKAVSRKVNALELSIGKLIDDLVRLKDVQGQLSNLKGVGSSALDIGGEFAQAPANAIKNRRRRQLARSAELAQAQAELLDAPKLEPGQSATIVSGGFARASGKSSDIIAAQTQALLGDTSKAIGVRNEATDIQIPKFLTKLLGEKDFLAGVPLAGLGKFLEQNILNGQNPDAIKAAAQALAVRRENPEANVGFLGYSAGGYVAQEAVEILQQLGIQSSGVGLGTPRFGASATTTPDQFKGVMGELDILNNVQQNFTPRDAVTVTGAGKDHQFEEYLANPEVQGLVQKQLKLPELGGSQTSLGQYRQVKFSATANLFQSELSKVRSLSGSAQNEEADRLAKSIPYFRSQIDKLIASSSQELAEQLKTYLGELQEIEKELDDLSKPGSAASAVAVPKLPTIPQTAPQPPPAIGSDRFNQSYSNLVNQTAKIAGVDLSPQQFTKLDTKTPLPKGAGAGYDAARNQVTISPEKFEFIQESLNKDINTLIDKDLSEVAKQLSLVSHEVFHASQYGFAGKSRTDFIKSGGQIQTPTLQVSDQERATFQAVRGNSIEKLAAGSRAGAKAHPAFAQLSDIEKATAEQFITDLEIGAYSFEAKFITEFLKQAETAQQEAGATIADVFDRAIANVSAQIQQQSGVIAKPTASAATATTPAAKPAVGSRAETALKGYNLDVVKEIAKVSGRGAKGKKDEIIQDLIANVGLEDLAAAIAAVKPLIEIGPKGGQKLKKVEATDIERQLLAKTAESEKRIQDSLQLFNKAEGERRQQLAASIANEIEFTTSTLEKLGTGQIAPESRMEAGRRKGRLEGIRRAVSSETGEPTSKPAATVTPIRPNIPTETAAAIDLAVEQIPVKFSLDLASLEPLNQIEAQLKAGFTVPIRMGKPDIVELKASLDRLKSQLESGLLAGVTFAVRQPALEKLKADLARLQSQSESGLKVGVALVIKQPALEKLKADLARLQSQSESGLKVGVAFTGIQAGYDKLKQNIIQIQDKLKNALVIGVHPETLGASKFNQLKQEIEVVRGKLASALVIGVQIGSLNIEAVEAQIQKVAASATGITVPIQLGNATAESLQAELQQIASTAESAITVPVRLGALQAEEAIAQVKEAEAAIAQLITIPVKLSNIAGDATKEQLAAIREQAATGVTVPVKLGSISAEKLAAELAKLKAEVGEGLAVPVTLKQPNTGQLQKDINSLQEKLKNGLQIPVLPRLTGLTESISKAITAGFEQGYQRAARLQLPLALPASQGVQPQASTDQAEVDNLLGSFQVQPIAAPIDLGIAQAQTEVNNLLGSLLESQPAPVPLDLDTSQAQAEVDNLLGSFAEVDFAFEEIDAPFAQVEELIERGERVAQELQEGVAGAVSGVKAKAAATVASAQASLSPAEQKQAEENQQQPRLPKKIRQLISAFQVGEQAPKSLSGFIKSLDDTVAKAIPGLSKLGITASGAIGAFVGFQGIQFIVLQAGTALQQFLKTSFDASIKLGNLKTALTFGSGSSGQAGKDLAFVRDTASSLGTPLGAAQAGFVKLAAATRGTALQGAATRDVFLGIQQASTVLGLSADEVNGALLALSQSASKGTVQSEELRSQLGERIPGAFSIAARSMGVTEGALSKMLELGQVTANEFLPKFGKQLQIEFGGAAQSASQNAQSALYRFDSALLKVQESVGGLFTPAVAVAANAFSVVLENIAKMLQDSFGVVAGFFVPMIVHLPIATKLVSGLTSALAGLFKFLISNMQKFLLETVVITGAVEVLKGLMQIFVPDDLGQQFKGFADQAEANLKRIEEAAKKARGETDKIPQSMPSQGINLTLGLGNAIVGRDLKTDDLINVFNAGNESLNSALGVDKDAGRLTTVAELKQQENVLSGDRFKAATDETIGLVQSGRVTNSKGEVVSLSGQLNKIAGFDQQISALQAQKNLLSNSANPDKKRITEIDAQISGLQNSKQQETSSITERKAILTQAKNDARTAIEAINADTKLPETAKAEQRRAFELTLKDIDNAEKAISKFESGVKTSVSAARDLENVFIQIAANLDTAVRKAQQLANTKTARAIESQTKDFSKDQLASQKTGVKTAQAEQENVQTQFDSQKSALAEQEKQLKSDATQSILAGIPVGKTGKAITVDSSVAEIEQAIKDVGEKNPDGKKVLEQLKQYKEGLSKLTETDKQLQQSKLATKQAEQVLALATLDLANANRQAKSKRQSNDRIEKNTRAQLAEFGNKLDPAGALSRQADNDISAAKNGLTDVNAQAANAQKSLEELRAANAAGKISAEEFAKRERDLVNEISDLKVKKAQAELAIKEAIQRKALALIEREALLAESQVKRSENRAAAGFARERAGVGTDRARITKLRAGNNLSESDAAVAQADLGVRESDLGIRQAEQNRNSAEARQRNAQAELDALNKAQAEGKLNAEEFAKRRIELENKVSDASRASAEAGAAVTESRAKREEAIAAQIEANNRRIIENLELANRKAEAAIALSQTTQTTATRSRLLEVQPTIYGADVSDTQQQQADRQFQAQQTAVDSQTNQIEAQAIQKRIAQKQLEIEQNRQLVADKVRGSKEGTEVELRLQQELADLNASALDKELSGQKLVQDRLRQRREVEKQLKESKQQLEDATLSYYQKIASLEQESLDRASRLLSAQQELAKARSDYSIAQSQGRLNVTDKALNIRQQLNSDNLSDDKRSVLERQLGKLGFSQNDDETKILEKKQQIEDSIAEKKAAQLAMELEFQQRSLDMEEKKNKLAAENLKFEAEKAKLDAQRQKVEALADLKSARKRGDKDGEQMALAKLEIASQQEDVANRQYANADAQSKSVDEEFRRKREAQSFRSATQITDAFNAERLREVDQSLALGDAAASSGRLGRNNLSDAGSILSNAFVAPGAQNLSFQPPSGSVPSIPTSQPPSFTPSRLEAQVNALNQAVSQTPVQNAGIDGNIDRLIGELAGIRGAIETLNNRIEQLANTPRSLSFHSQDPNESYAQYQNRQTANALRNG